MQFDKNKLETVATLAKSKTTDRRWHLAVDRALAGMLSGWMITELVGYVLITTGEEDGKTHRVNGRCDCEASQHGNSVCKHRAAKRLLELYQSPQVERENAILVKQANPKTYLQIGAWSV